MLPFDVERLQGLMRGQGVGRGFGPRELATRFRNQRTGELVSTDFAALAKAMGADGYRITTPGDFDDALAAALAANRPSLIDVPVRSDERPVSTGGGCCRHLSHAPRSTR